MSFKRKKIQDSLKITIQQKQPQPQKLLNNLKSTPNMLTTIIIAVMLAICSFVAGSDLIHSQHQQSFSIHKQTGVRTILATAALAANNLRQQQQEALVQQQRAPESRQQFAGRVLRYLRARRAADAAASSSTAKTAAAITLTKPRQVHEASAKHAPLVRRHAQAQEHDSSATQKQVAATAGRWTGGSAHVNDLWHVGTDQSTAATAGGESLFYGVPRSVIKNVTVQSGQSVVLHCLVEPSSDMIISWFRGYNSFELLTIENQTVIADDRFALRQVRDDNWALQIKSVDKMADAGLYQCQQNTDPPKSLYYLLNIVEPQVTILGSPDMAVELGAQTNLTCVISPSPDQLQFVFWYHDARMINYDLGSKCKISSRKSTDNTIISELLISESSLPDSGNYTCMPSGANSSSIYVHVVEDAADKRANSRLTMFQNDNPPSPNNHHYYNNYNYHSASSQQQHHHGLATTNSAAVSTVGGISAASVTHVYALLAIASILIAWYQLVAQAQTCASLVLVAVFGVFLSRCADECDRRGELRRSKQAKADNKSGTSNNNNNNNCDDDDIKFCKKLTASEEANNRQATNKRNKTLGASLSPDRHDADQDCNEALLKRANSALNLLTAISRSSLDSNLGSSRSPSSSAAQTPSPNTSAATTTAAAGCTVASSGGYIGSNESLSELRNINDDDDDEMIELCALPSALSIMMDAATTTPQLSNDNNINRANQ